MSGAEFARFASDLLRASTGIDAMANVAAEKVGRGALKSAIAYSPDDTGALDRSLRLRRRGSVAIVETSLYYAAFQEYGTSKMAPNPFMGPAADEWGPRLVQEVEGIRDEVVRKL
jgi:HK97 gp10 family phage protein